MIVKNQISKPLLPDQYWMDRLRYRIKEEVILVYTDYILISL